MKKKLLLLPLFLLVLAACGPTTSSDPGSIPGTSITSDEDSLPPPPSSSEIVGETMTISEIRDIPLNASGTLDAGDKKLVRTTGTVTNIARRASGNTYNVTIQDGEEAMLLYAITEEKIADFGQVGDVLTVEGTTAPYNFLWELAPVKVISKVAGTPIVPKTLTSVAQSSLAGLDSVLVKIEGLQFVSGEVVADTNADNLTFKLGDDSISGYLHYAIPEDIQQAIADALVPTGDADGKIDSMDTLTFTGILDMNNKVYQLAITDASNFSDVTDGGEPAAPTEFLDMVELRAGIKAGTLKANDVVDFEGVVVAKDNFSSQYNNGEIVLQSTVGNETAGIFVYRVPTAQYDALAVGNLVRGSATIGAYSGLDQLVAPFGPFTVVEAVGPTQTPVELTEALIGDADFVGKTGTLVTATELTATADVAGTAGTDLTVTLTKGAKTIDLFASKSYSDHADVIAKLNLIKAGYTVELEDGAAWLGWRNTARVMLLDADKIIVRDLDGNVVGETIVDPGEPGEPGELALLSSFDFMDGGDSGNNGYANTNITTNIKYATNNPGGTTGTTAWEFDYSNLSLTYGTRLGGKLASEPQTDNTTAWANMRTMFTISAAVNKVEVSGAVYFGNNAMSHLTGLHLQSSLDGVTWTTVQTLPVPSDLTKSASGNNGQIITFADLNIPANSYLRFGVGLTAQTGENLGFQFTGFAIYTNSAI